MVSDGQLLIRFQSTLPVRGATLDDHDVMGQILISIHAPRAGSDLFCLFALIGLCDFNPRSPCGERLVVDRTPVTRE